MRGYKSYANITHAKIVSIYESKEGLILHTEDDNMAFQCTILLMALPLSEIKGTLGIYDFSTDVQFRGLFMFQKYI